jgi:glycyl-tRNA synthetase
MKLFDKVVALCSRRGIIFPSHEIYGGTSGFYDWGPIGVLLRQNFIRELRKELIKGEGIFEVNTPLFAPQIVWKASGHLESFTDVLVDCSKCGQKFRADHLIEDITGITCEHLSAEEMKEILEREKIACPRCKGKLGKMRVFNLMFQTQVGPLKGDLAYAKPENAQGIFLAFKRIQRSMRAKLPFGIAQLDKCLRNEISPRDFVFRIREFTLLDLEFFVHPKKKDDVPKEKWNKVKGIKLKLLPAKEQKKKRPRIVTLSTEEAFKRKVIKTKWHAYWLAKVWNFLIRVGVDPKKLRFRQQLREERAFYSIDTWDAEARFSFGWKEIFGCADRGDYDLRQHMKFSGEDLSYYDEGEKKKIVPHVIEPSMGIERPIHAILEHCYREDKERIWLQLPSLMVPYQVGVFPLVAKDNLPVKARKVYELLKEKFELIYDQDGSIGRRYRRIDEIGVPFGVTIDYQTLKDQTVTIRDRDTMKQIRVKIKELIQVLEKLLGGKLA